MSERARRHRATFLLLAPPTAFLIAAFVVPVGQMLARSFLEPEPGLGQYIELFTDPSSIAILQRTAGISFIVTGACLLLSYPYAYAMTIVGPRVRTVLIALVLLPFWISLIARTFAWMVLFQRGGIVEAMTAALGLDVGALIGTPAAVVIAMVQVLLPFMVLPLYNSMSDIDLQLMKASASLGAKRLTQFTTVFLPLSLPGVLSGVVLVFVMCLGFYLTPELIGSPQQPVVGQLIATRVQRLLDFAGAGALAMVLLVITVVLLAAVSRTGGGAAAGVVVLEERSRRGSRG